MSDLPDIGHPETGPPESEWMQKTLWTIRSRKKPNAVGSKVKLAVSLKRETSEDANVYIKRAQKCDRIKVFYPCSVCGKRFLISDLAQHMEEHSHVACMVCEREFPLGKVFAQHMLLHQLSACEICGKVFTCVEHLTNHINDKHPDDSSLKECSSVEPSNDTTAISDNAEQDSHMGTEDKRSNLTTVGEIVAADGQNLANEKDILPYMGRVIKRENTEENSESPKPPKYPCSYPKCSLVFDKHQAYAGHMNTHKSDSINLENPIGAKDTRPNFMRMGAADEQNSANDTGCHGVPRSIKLVSAEENPVQYIKKMSIQYSKNAQAPEITAGPKLLNFPCTQPDCSQVFERRDEFARHMSTHIYYDARCPLKQTSQRVEIVVEQATDEVSDEGTEPTGVLEIAPTADNDGGELDDGNLGVSQLNLKVEPDVVDESNGDKHIVDSVMSDITLDMTDSASYLKGLAETFQTAIMKEAKALEDCAESVTSGIKRQVELLTAPVESIKIGDLKEVQIALKHMMTSVTNALAKCANNLDETRQSTNVELRKLTEILAKSITPSPLGNVDLGEEHNYSKQSNRNPDPLTLDGEGHQNSSNTPRTNYVIRATHKESGSVFYNSMIPSYEYSISTTPRISTGITDRRHLNELSKGIQIVSPQSHSTEVDNRNIHVINIRDQGENEAELYAKLDPGKSLKFIGTNSEIGVNSTPVTFLSEVSVGSIAPENATSCEKDVILPQNLLTSEMHYDANVCDNKELPNILVGDPNIMQLNVIGVPSYTAAQLLYAQPDGQTTSQFTGSPHVSWEGPESGNSTSSLAIACTWSCGSSRELVSPLIIESNANESSANVSVPMAVEHAQHDDINQNFSEKDDEEKADVGKTDAGKKLMGLKYRLDKLRDIQRKNAEKKRMLKCIGKKYTGMKYVVKNGIKEDRSPSRIWRRKNVCHVCGLNCMVKKNLIGHLKQHINPFPYECDICRLAFSSKRKWQDHRRTHMLVNDGSLKCKVCDRMFTSKESLSRHVLRHRKRKPKPHNLAQTKTKKTKKASSKKAK